MKRLDIFKLFKAAGTSTPPEGGDEGPTYNPPYPKEYWDKLPHLKETVKQPGWLSITPEGTHSDEEVNVEGKRPLTQQRAERMREESKDTVGARGAGFHKPTTPEKLREILGDDQEGFTAQLIRGLDQITGHPPRHHIGEHGWDDKYGANQEVRDRMSQHYPELRNSSAMQNLLKYAIENAETSPYGGQPHAAPPTEEQEEEHERIMRDIGQRTVIEEARQGQRIKERAAETPKAENWQEQLGQDVGRTVGAIGSVARFVTDVGSAGASADRSAVGQMAQGPIQGSPGGVGTGRSTAISRQKAQQPPPAQRQPQMSRTHQMMEKDYEADKYEDEYEEYNVKERQPPSEMGTSGHSVKGLQQLIRRRAQQAENKRGN